MSGGRSDQGSDETEGRRTTLKDIAHQVGLSPATVSLVLNRAPAAKGIPSETHQRVLEAAEELGYRPNLLARSLRNQRSRTVGILLPELSEGYAAGVLSGIEGQLSSDGYFFFVSSHRQKQDLVDDYFMLLKDRQVDGFVLINTPLDRPPGLPTVAVSGHDELEGVTNVVVDHGRAADLALSHLAQLGHERIAFFKGHPWSTDTEERWEATLAAAARLGLEVDPNLTLQLSGDPAGEVFSTEEGYQEGYVFGRKLLKRGRPFTALFAFNDVSAIGALRAFLDAGLRVPEDVSVVGFDDILSAAFHNPGLTTVRQPLAEMGRLAASTLLRRLAGEEPDDSLVRVAPELVVRETTGPATVRRRRTGRPKKALS